MNIFILAAIVFFFILAVLTTCFVKLLNRNVDSKLDRQTETSFEYDQLITQQQIKLNHIEQQIAESQQLLFQLKQHQLRPELEQALDTFEKSNIRIPSDIIEDAATRFFQSDIQAIKFIENQRYVWKQENMKKLYKE